MIHIMSNTINLDAEIGANFIGDDAQPSITISNSSTGSGLEVHKLAVASSASVDSVNIGGPILAASATVTNMNIHGSSVASGALIGLKGDAFISASTINTTTSAVAGLGAIRVARSDGTFGWIPVYPDGAVTTAAV